MKILWPKQFRLLTCVAPVQHLVDVRVPVLPPPSRRVVYDGEEDVDESEDGRLVQVVPSPGAGAHEQLDVSDDRVEPVDEDVPEGRLPVGRLAKGRFGSFEIVLKVLRETAW